MNELVYSEIIVYSKTGSQLAVFSNDNAIQSEEAKRNLLITPTVHNVMSADSTLTFTMLRTSKKWQQVNHPENEWNCHGKVYTMINPEKSITYEGETVNVVLHELQVKLMKQYVQAHNVDLSVEAIDVHTIKILPKTSVAYSLTVNGIKYSDSVVKDNRGVLQPRGSAGYALWALIQGNRYGWKIGVCDVIVNGFNASIDYGTFNFETDKESIYDNIKHIPELWGGILIFDSLNKLVHLRDESKQGTDFNTWKGFTAHEDKNMLSKPQMQVDNNIITRAYPLGNGDIHIKPVNNNQLHIDNFSYTTEVYEGYIFNNNIHYTGSADNSGQIQLKAWAERELAKLCKPREFYLFTIFDRRYENNFKHEIFELNDVVKVFFLNPITSVVEEKLQRVIDVQYDVWRPQEKSVVLGDTNLNVKDVYGLTYLDDTTQGLTDWNGTINGNSVYIPLSDYAKEYFGGSNYASMTRVTELYAEKITETTEAVAAVRVYADETFATVESFTSFKAETANGFTQSNTKITQVSDALSAQITLEAQHHQQSLTFTTTSVSGLRTYVDGTFAQATLNAAYSYTNTEVGKVENSLAEFEVYASRNYASASMLAQTNSSLASVKATADGAYSSVNIVASRTDDIDNSSGRITVSSLYTEMRYSDGYFRVDYTRVTIRDQWVNITGTRELQVSSPKLTLSSSGGDITITSGSNGDIRLTGKVYVNGKLLT